MQHFGIIQHLDLHAMAHLAEDYDPEIGRHIHRVQGYVDILVHKLRFHSKYSHLLPNFSTRLLGKAALLHDIGKVGIPNAILFKPGPLTPEEFEVMKQHSLIGAEIIDLAITCQQMQDAVFFEVGCDGSQAFLKAAREIARYHHEKWDGSGYLEGLAGEAIPLPARIMAIADVFDTITTKRVYKKPQPVDEAIQIIQRDSGTYFDPGLVEVFSWVTEKFRDLSTKPVLQ